MSEVMTRFKRWVELSTRWSIEYQQDHMPLHIIRELQELDKEFLPINSRQLVISEYDKLTAENTMLKEALGFGALHTFHPQASVQSHADAFLRWQEIARQALIEARNILTEKL